MRSNTMRRDAPRLLRSVYMLAIVFSQASGCTNDAPRDASSPLQFADPTSLPLINDAQAVVVGVAGEGSAQWSDTDQDIYTSTSFRVEEVQRGIVPATLTLRTRGGELNGKAHIFMHEAVLNRGERVRLFLDPLADGTWKVVGGYLGKQLPLNVGPTSDSSAPVVPTSQALTCQTNYCVPDHSPRYSWTLLPIPWILDMNYTSSHVANTSSDVVNAVKQGFSSWESDPNSAMEWAYQGTTSSASAPAGTWWVGWGVPDAGGYTGSAQYWIDLTTTPASFIVGSVTLNQDLCWRTDGVTSAKCTADRCTLNTPGCTNTRADTFYYDIQHVITHESGHALGLDHQPTEGQTGGALVPDTNNVMYFAYTGLRTLGPGDLAGVRALYPTGWSSWENVRSFNGGGGFEVSYGVPGEIVLFSNEQYDATHTGQIFDSRRLPGQAWSVRDTFSINGSSKPSVFGAVLFGSEAPFVALRGANDQATWVYIQPNYAGAPTGTSYGGLTNRAPTMVLDQSASHLFVIGTDNALWHRTSDSKSTWTQVSSQQLTSDPKAIEIDPGEIMLLARGPNNDVLTGFYRSGSFSGWSSIGGSVLGAPTGAAPDSTHAYVWAVGTDHTLWMIEWNYFAGWGYWGQFDSTVVSGDPAAVAWKSTRVDVFAKTGTGLGGQVIHKRGAW